MAFSRKASLSLSINAIVILVLAITMLGLGLAFTKGMFGKLSSKLSVPEPDIPATADDPIVLPSDELTITKNKEFIFSVNFYNDGMSGDVRGKLTCLTGPNNAPAFAVCSSPQAVPAGEDKGFKFIMPSYAVTTTDTRVCNLGFDLASDTTSFPSTDACSMKGDATTPVTPGTAAFSTTAVTKQVVVTVR